MSPRWNALLLVLLLAAPVGVTDTAGALTDAPDGRAAAAAGNATLFEERFDQRFTSLEALGWHVDVREGPANAWVRSDAHGGRATTLVDGNPYPRGLDARLVSPPLDVRHAPGAPTPHPGAPAVPPAEEARDTAADGARNASDHMPGATVAANGSRPGATVDARDAWAPLVWPPGTNATRDVVRWDATPAAHDPRTDAPDGRVRAGPADSPEATHPLSLVIRHAWDFAPADGGYLEIRTRNPDGAWSAWHTVPPAPPAAEAATVGGVLPAGAWTGHTGTLPSGEAAFTGASDGVRETHYRLDAYAGHVLQVAFHVKSAAPLPPDGFGWSVDAVRLEGVLGSGGVVHEGYAVLEPDAAVALDTAFTPRAIFRNWGAHPAPNVTVQLEAYHVDGRPLAGSPHAIHLGTLAPGQRITVPYPAPLRFDEETQVYLRARVLPLGVDPEPPEPPRRPAALREDPGMPVRFADVAEARLDLTLTPSDAVTASGATKRFEVTLTNAGNAPLADAVRLFATPLDPATLAPAGTPREVARALPHAAPAPRGPVAGVTWPPHPSTSVTVAWAPGEADVGAYRVTARYGNASSSPVYAYVDVAPAPVLHEPFDVPSDPARALPAASAHRLTGWRFDGWNLTDGNPERQLPAAPSPRHVLAARVDDALVSGTLDGLDGVGGRFVLRTPDAVNPPDATKPATPPVHHGVNASYGRLLFTAEPVLCLDPATPVPTAPVLCEDPATRVTAVPLRALLNATVSQENLTLENRETTLRVDGVSIRHGDAEAGFVYVVVDGDPDPGLDARWSPLVVERAEGDGLTVLPGGSLREYVDDNGLVRCCVVGPLSASALVGGVAEPAAGAVPPGWDATRILGAYEISRDLSDLAAGIDGGGLVVAFEHRGAFRWVDGQGVRGVVELVRTSGPGAVVASRIFDADTGDWSGVRIPVRAADLQAGLTLRFRLEAAGASPADAFGPCPYLHPAAACDAAPAWFVDDVRILQRTGPEGMRVVGRDTLESPDALKRWTGDSSATPRGWRLEDTGAGVPHRFGLTTGGRPVDGEWNATRALRWGEPASDRIATLEPMWSLARTPFLDLSHLTAPTLSFATRYDFGPERNGAFPAGGAVVALVATDPPRRVLLQPTADASDRSASYRGDVDAPAFTPVARALRVQVPEDATATAFVGGSGAPLGDAGAAGWVDAAFDLSVLGDLLRHPVAFEFHAVSAGRLDGPGWIVDDLRVGEPGSGRDLALTGFPTPAAGTAAAEGTPVPLRVNVTNAGTFDPAPARLHLRVVDAAGTPVFQPPPVPIPEAPEPGATRAYGIPDPWVPPAVGTYTLEAWLATGPLDERPENDRARRTIDVRNVAAAALEAPAGGLVDAQGGVALVDEAVTLRFIVHNTGTLPLGPERPAVVTLDIREGAGASVLAEPLRVDVASHLGRILAAGERVEVTLPDAWVPDRSGVYRVTARLAYANATGPAMEATTTLTVEQPIPGLHADRFLPTGSGWTNATRGDPPSAWHFNGDDPAEGALELAEPLNLRNARQASLRLTHRYDFEDGFDGGRLEVRTPNGTWVPVRPAEGESGTLHVPNPLAAGDAAAFTGERTAVHTSRFDLGDVDALRETFALLDRPAPGTPGVAVGDFNATEQWLGPVPPADANETYWAPSRPAPSGAPADATAHARHDFLVIPFRVPEDAEGVLRARFLDWRALGLSGADGVPASDVRIYVEAVAADGSTERFPADLSAREAAYDDNYRDWTPVDAAFPGAAEALAGREAQLVIEHVEVHARVPARYAFDRQNVPAFASDAVSPHGGYALTPPRIVHVDADGTHPLNATGAPRTAARGTWLTGEGALPSPDVPETAGPVTDGSPFRSVHDGGPTTWSVETRAGRPVWVAQAASPFADARLIAPVDLTPTVGNVTLTLHERHRLTTLTDTVLNVSGAASLAGVEVSTDGGRTWIPVDPVTDGRVAPQAAFTVDGTAPNSRHATLAGPRADPEANSAHGPGARGLTGDAPEVGAVQYDLSAFAGQPVLVALHASFSTHPAARDDVWVVEGLRLTGDLFRGTDVHVRLRAATDGTGASEGWDVIDLEGSIVEAGPGRSVHVLAPGDGPLTQGFRTLEVEVVNRGPEPVPEGRLHFMLQDPPELGGRVRHANRTVPAIPAGESAFVHLRGGDVNWYLAANASPTGVRLDLPPIPGEATAVDNRVTTTLGGPNVVDRARLHTTRLDVLPQYVDVSDDARPPVAFTAHAWNRGEDPVSLAPGRLLVYDEDTPEPVRVIEAYRADATRVDPGGDVAVTWTWRPAGDLAPGRYRVVAEVATATARDPLVDTVEGLLLVGDGPYVGARARLATFEADAAGWTCASAPPCARHDATVNHSGSASLAIGIPDGAEAPGDGRVLVESPDFPVEQGVATWLRLHVRHALPPGSVARVLAAPVLDDGSTGPFREVAAVTGRSSGYDEGAFTRLEADLSGVGANATGHAVRLRLDAPPPAAGGAPALWVDDVSVTPFQVAWDAPPGAAITDAVTKRLRFQLDNPADVAGTYVLAFQDARGRSAVLPEGWTARVEHAETGRVLATTDSGAPGVPVPVAAHARLALDLVLETAPSGAASPLRGPVRFPLTATSLDLPDLARTLNVDLVAAGEPRPDVAVTALRDRGDGDPAGRLRTVEVAVTNRGLAPVTAHVTLAASPEQGGGAPTTLATPEGATRATVTLAPGAVETVAFLWTPAKSGGHRLSALAEPAADVVEATRDNNGYAATFQVPDLPFPDVRTTLQLDGPEPMAGTPTGFTLTVENRGAVPARGVEVTLGAGATSLLDGTSPRRVGDLAPGETWTHTGTWWPEVAGPTRVTATAFARGGAPERVETLGDNAATRLVHVREAAVRLDALSAPEPGGGDVLVLPFRLTNAGNAPDAFRLHVHAPTGWWAALEIEDAPASRVHLDAGEAVNVTARILPVGDAPAGPIPITLEAAGEKGSRTQATADAPVPAVHATSVRLGDTRLDPNDPALDVVVTNRGNAPDTVTFAAATLPDGWRLAGTRVEVPAGETRYVRLALDLPDATPPGTRVLRLAWNATVDADHLTAEVTVPPVRDLHLTGDAHATAGGEDDFSFTLTHRGNAPVAGLLHADAPAGWSVVLARDGLRLEPGETRTVRGVLAAPADATGTAHVTLRFTGDVDRQVRLPVTVQYADLAVETVERRGHVDPRPGDPVHHRVTVHNRGNTSAQNVTVVLYADARAVASQALGTLPPGAVADADLTWRATAGDHVTTVEAWADGVVADATPGDNTLADGIRVDDDPLGRVIPGGTVRDAPASGLLALAALLAGGILSAPARRRFP